MIEIINYSVCFILGFITALAELLARYKEISKIFKNCSSIAYLIINGSSSIIAFKILTEINMLNDNITLKIILSGVSSMIILRSSIANLRIDNKEVKSGIAQIIQIYLDTAENSFDKKRSIEDVGEIDKIMVNIDFNEAKLSLPVTCFNLMKSIPEDIQEKIREEVSCISKTNFPNKTKSINLGIILSKVTGLKFLKAAIKVLGEDIIVKKKKKNEIDVLLNKLGRE